MNVIFEKGKDGSPMTRVDGKVSFPERRGPRPAIGDQWEVEVAGQNATGKVNFLRLVRLVKRSSTAQEREAVATQVKAQKAAQAAAIAAEMAEWEAERAAVAKKLDKDIVLAALRRGETPVITVRGSWTGEDGFYANPISVEIGGQYAEFESAARMYAWSPLYYRPGAAGVEFWQFLGWNNLADDLAEFTAPQVSGYEPEEWKWGGRVLQVRGWSAMGQFTIEDAHADGVTDVVLRGAANPETLHAECESARQKAEATARRADYAERIANIERRLGGYPTPGTLDEDAVREVTVGGHIFVLSAWSYFDSGSEYAAESDDGYRRGGWFQASPAGKRTERALTFDGQTVHRQNEITDDWALLAAMEDAFLADSPEGAIFPGETRAEAEGRIMYDAEYGRDTLPNVGAEWRSDSSFIAEAGPLTDADKMYFFQVLVDRAGKVVYETGGTLDNRYSRSGQYLHATHGSMYNLHEWLASHDPRLLTVAWVK